MSVEQEIAHLNLPQRQAVEKVEGRVLILAGAGSGKTRVLTLRMAYLISVVKKPPESILGLTFTKKAAEEMRQRLASFIDPKIAKKVTLCTFHSFCMQILRQEIPALGYTPTFSLYDEQDMQRLMNLIARDVLDQEGELPSLAPTVAVIRQAKNKGWAAEDLPEATWHDQFARTVYQRLQASMRAYNAVDFDHLLGLTVELFDRFPDILARYQDRFRYIMIDEYQDTNPIQYRLASLLSAKSNNLCVVGDDDQSIYGWRGAEVKNILEFDNATLIKLEQNYRSTNEILQAANAVIKNNQERHQKVLWSEKKGGSLLEVFHAPTECDEAEAIVKRMVKLRDDEGLRWHDMAILYRSNLLSREFEHALRRHTWKNGEVWVQGIPYEIVGGQEFYERKEVKDICAYLRLIVNPLDQEALLRIINQPRRGIGEETLDRLTKHNREQQIPLWDVLFAIVKNTEMAGHLEMPVRTKKAIEGFVFIIEEAKQRFATGKLADSLRWLVERINYQHAIKEEVKSQQMRDFKMTNVLEFIESLQLYEEQEANRSLASFVSGFALDQTYGQQRHRSGQDQVQLMTFHSAKGLEFPACFLVSLEDHLIPHEKSMKETGIEEERRLMYVALTRAKKHLTLSMAQKRKRMGKEAVSRPSRFLFEIPRELLRTTDWRTVS